MSASLPGAGAKLPGDMKKRPRVLCYSPYNYWELHGLWEITILQALNLRGAEVRHVLCDGLYTECDIFWAATAPRHQLSCVQCQARVADLNQRLALPFEWLGRYLNPNDFSKARKWVEGLAPRDYADAAFHGWEIAAWVKSSVHSHLRRSHLDLSDPLVQEAYKGYLYSGLVAASGLDRLLRDYRPEVLFLFNGRLSSTTVALELAKRRGIRVVCHERGLREESIILAENAKCMDLQVFKTMWRDWGEVPLSGHELEEIRQYMLGRQYGRGFNWRAYNPPPQAPGELRRQLNLKPGRPVWALFTSSDDEVISEGDWQSPFARQLDWILRTIDFLRDRPEIGLVIRVHPNTAGKKARGDNLVQLQEFAGLKATLPANVRLVMPDDPVSSYTLMDLAALGLVYQSTVGLELACKGKQVIVAAGCYVSDLPFLHTVKDADAYEPLLKEMANLPVAAVSPDIQRLACRYAHGLFFRWNLPFPLVTMPDPHHGRLAYDSLEALLPGQDHHLDRICRIILDREAIVPPPSAQDRRRCQGEEPACFASPSAEVSPPPAEDPEDPPPPLISIVIPAYNKAGYIGETISSILEQDFQDYEIIVVDDGSTDDTAKTVQGFGGRVRYFYQDNDGFQGPGAAINLGLTKCRGQFIHCLDADDLVLPGFYRQVLNALASGEHIGAVATDALQIDAAGQAKGVFKLGHFTNMGEFRLESLHHNPIIASATVVRKKVYEKVGGRRP